jgi:hypothetical protein
MQDIEANRLGNPHTMELLKQLRPAYWYQHTTASCLQDATYRVADRQTMS